MNATQFENAMKMSAQHWRSLTQSQRNHIHRSMTPAQFRKFKAHIAGHNVVSNNSNPANSSDSVAKKSTTNAYDDYFVYTIYIATIPKGNAPTAVSLQLDSDADFQWLRSSYNGGAVYTGGSVYTSAQVTIQDQGNGRYLSNEAIYIDMICGDYGLPFINPVGHIFPANSTVLFTFNNTSTTTDITDIYFSMIGTKRFFYGR